MSCKHCVLKVENAITNALGEVKVSVDLKSKMVRVEGTAEVEKIKDAITNAGYTPEILV
ncbi:MAG TPA: heavy-metal-associated domain-containing protein [candidate division Zixibacteria bacterium]|nr:heavy-metal-associated domain-containing protein [candidate division Zixibacteria bacterium]